MATPKPVRKRHKEQMLSIKHKLKEHMPSTAKETMKSHMSTVKKSKAKFKEMGGTYGKRHSKEDLSKAHKHMKEHGG